MTTPNELIKRLSAIANTEANELADALNEAADLLQSQAERIAELERESETHSKAYGLAIVERDNLRAQLAEIATTEPVATINDLGNARMFTLEANGYSRKDKLFTRPMPAQDVTLSLTDEQRTAIYESVKYEDNEGYWAVNYSDVIDATLAALSKYKGAK